MEELLELLQGVRDDIDFTKEEKLIDDKILTSFDIIQIIAAIDDEYDVSIPATQIVPDNFNSMQAIYDMIQGLLA